MHQCQYLYYKAQMKLTQLIQLRVTEEFAREIDDWRRNETDLPNRSEAARRLIKAGLEAPRPAGDSKAGTRPNTDAD